MTIVASLIAAGLDALEADPALAARLQRVLMLVPPPPAKIPLAIVVQHGAPSTSWVRARGRRGEIEIHGPRGAQYVLADELAALLARTTIARRRKATPPIAEDARATISDLAARRARRSA